jgi:TrkA domain protein
VPLHWLKEADALPTQLEETRLPGIGTKFTIRSGEGSRLTVILHNDGKRELYYFRRGSDDEPRSVITLDDDEARQLGAVLGGAYERPKIVEELEMALGELLIEWTPVPDVSPWIGKSLAEAGFRAKLGITVIAILREPEPVTGALPDDVIQQGDTLVTVGKAGSYPAFQRALATGDLPPEH